MSKRKIAFVLDDTLDTPDGVQQYVLTLGTWLSCQGHDVHYLVGQTNRTDIRNVRSLSRNLKVQFNGNRMSTPLPASSRAIRKLLQEEKFDVMHVQIPYSPFMASKVIRYAPADTAVFGTFHIAPHSHFVRIANRLLGAIIKKSLRRFDSVFAVSDAAAVFAKKAYRINTVILPNVVLAAVFRDAEPLDVPKEQFTLMFLGRLVPRKGCRDLLEALVLLKDEPVFKNVYTYICGKGPLQEELQAFVAKKGMDQRIEFVGFVNDHTKARYLATADLAVFPSTGGESFGIVLLEAMAAERPVVLGASNEGYATVLGPNQDLLFPVRDPKRLAAKILGLLEDKAARSSALAWQRQYIHQFDVGVVGRRLVARYEEVLRTKRNMR